MFQILVVEDDNHIRRLIETVLKQNGYKPICAVNGEAALGILDTEHIDLVILDIMMPKMDGYELTRLIRQVDIHMPILFVTAKETYEDKKKGFLLGIDDYMVKPIDVSEMLLRINALLRRAKIANEHKITLGEITLNYDALSVSRRSQTMTLPPKEFYLLYKLMAYANVIFTRRQLLDEIWGMEHEVDERTVDVHIKRLRERFYEDKEFEIVTVRGLGYKLVKHV